MELKEVQYILAIAECGSLSKAAQHLYVAQSSLSQFLKNYEAQSGYTLFIRTPQGLKPTCEGALYIHTARQIMRMQNNLNNQLMELSGLQRGKVCFSLSSFRSPYLLPLVLPAFRRKYPNIEVAITEAHMARQERLLAEGRADVAFLSLPLENQEIPYLKVIEEEIFLAAPDGHPITAQARRNPATGRMWIDYPTMNGQDFLLYSINHRLSTFSDQIFTEHHIAPKIIQTHDSFETLIRLAEVGMGLTFIPKTYIDNRHSLSYFSIGETGQFRTLVLGYPPVGYLSKATRAFSNMVIDMLQEQHRALDAKLKEGSHIGH
ncbi:LysR family transcriptional regulator [Enterocloster lavalensis]|uniref:LysR family transcriptional regulator n=1 Tax=Enterocloster lavalensis TaxID=460384 RepID=UPI001D0809D2|nr:LysR family transcriptional regulator [Enterocloster lavalensis]MCB6346208.1 LysR family transcriptional regulator [Enterocloster lavalensis]